MAKKQFTPLYPAHERLGNFELRSFPDLMQFIEEGAGWRKRVWGQGKAFLLYIGRNKSEHTFLRFRSEVEKFLLWCFIVKGEDPTGFRKHEILEYVDFAGHHRPVGSVNSIWKSFVRKMGFTTVILIGHRFAPIRLHQSMISLKQTDIVHRSNR